MGQDDIRPERKYEIGCDMMNLNRIRSDRIGVDKNEESKNTWVR